jgi:HSP20 family protein
MRLTIKNGSNGNGSNGNGSNGNGSNGNGAIAGDADGEKSGKAERRLLPSELLRTLEASAGELGEAVLQILSGAKPYLPRIQVREIKDAILVSAALPGVDERSLEVAFEGRLLRIHGVKTEQRERTRRKYRRVQKIYRTFARAIPIHCDVEGDNAVATLRNGVLSIHAPKVASLEAKPVRVTAESVTAS